MAIRVAATLGLVDLAGSAGATAPRLAADTGTAEPALRRLLDHLVAVGVFDRDGDTYRPTDLGDQMRADAPGPGRLVLDINSAGGRAELAFVELLSSVTTGEAAYPRRYGRGFWADLDAEPELRRTFDLQMNRRFRVMAAQIAERYDWGRFGHIVDVGGGDGTVLAEIMQRHPDVRGTVVELPPTAAAAAERFATAGLQHRAATVPGSFFDALPSGADAYVLSDILHDWDDPHAAADPRPLRRGRRAARPRRRDRTDPRGGHRHAAGPVHADVLRRPGTRRRRAGGVGRRARPGPAGDGRGGRGPDPAGVPADPLTGPTACARTR